MTDSPSPAAEMRTAAQMLLDLADLADEDIEKNLYWRSDCHPREHWFANGIDNACGGPPGWLASMLSPALAREIGDWLRGQAKFVDDVISVHGRLPAQAVANITHPLAIARHILATAKEFAR